MSANEAYTFAFITGIGGVVLMYIFFNPASALLSAFSIFLYAFIYTPLKKSKFYCSVGWRISRCIALLNWLGCGNRYYISPFEMINVNGTDLFKWCGLGFIWHAIFMAVSAFLGYCLACL